MDISSHLCMTPQELIFYIKKIKIIFFENIVVYFLLCPQEQKKNSKNLSQLKDMAEVHNHDCLVELNLVTQITFDNSPLDSPKAIKIRENQYKLQIKEFLSNKRYEQNNIWKNVLSKILELIRDSKSSSNEFHDRINEFFLAHLIMLKKYNNYKTYHQNYINFDKKSNSIFFKKKK